ncbi:MAG TPA: ubiquinone biosynthesis regulatory protein kinase UbiB [Steroidobacteraceae bacterium]|jgi:ubiquinone biosynthesis protein|nr:ubiquinone biosynthesis regulatory protein kinase UbiB [Steroidobacteraceae bacterium]
MRLRVLVRLIQIQRVLVRHRLDDFVRATHLYRPLRFIYLVSPWTWFQRRSEATPGARLRLALEELGPIFVKFGQALSTRRDLLPTEIADELAKLQDKVPPFSGAVARAMIEHAYGTTLETRLQAFDETPLAAASIAQVHTASLLDGREVIVKVLRPGMQGSIERDIEVLHTIARMAQRWWIESRRLRPVEIVREYEKTILDELDLLREAANASQLKRNFAGTNLLYVPEIYWDHCRKDVLVMERIHGVPIGELDRLRAAGTDFRRLAENGVEIFFTQVFRHNFFHADMHPGNIFVLIDDPSQPRYAAVDFGIVGTLDLRDQRYLAENFLAVFDRNYRRVAELHVQSGWVPANTRVDEMESAVRTICEPIFDRPLKEIVFGAVLLRLFETLRRFNGQIQPQLLLLQKTLLSVEGLGRQLYPDLDIWQTASPVLRRWMRERLSPLQLIRELRRDWPDTLEILRVAPPLLQRTLEQFQDGTLRIPIDTRAIDELRADFVDQSRRGDRIIIGGALEVAAVLWFGLRLDPGWPGLVFAIAGGVVWVFAWLLTRRPPDPPER